MVWDVNGKKGYFCRLLEEEERGLVSIMRSWREEERKGIVTEDAVGNLMRMRLRGVCMIHESFLFCTSEFIW